MEANVHIDENKALFPLQHIAINININVPQPAKLKNKNDDVAISFRSSFTAKLKSAQLHRSEFLEQMTFIRHVENPPSRSQCVTRSGPHCFLSSVRTAQFISIFMNYSFTYTFAGFHNGEFPDSSLLSCDTVQSCITTPKFRSNVKSEHGDSVFLQRVITHLQDNPEYQNLKCSPVRFLSDHRTIGSSLLSTEFESRE